MFLTPIRSAKISLIKIKVAMIESMTYKNMPYVEKYCKKVVFPSAPLKIAKPYASTNKKSLSRTLYGFFCCMFAFRQRLFSRISQIPASLLL